MQITDSLLQQRGFVKSETPQFTSTFMQVKAFQVREIPLVLVLEGWWQCGCGR